MTESIENELHDRLALIESMIAQGRRTTARWSWSSVLWGVAYLVAMSWSAWGPHREFAWLICVGAALLLSFAIPMLGRGKTTPGKNPETTLGRAVGSIWLGLGVSMVLLFPALGLSGRLGDVHIFIAVVAAFLGMANGACAVMLRWKVQFACAVLWWATSVAACRSAAGSARASSPACPWRASCPRSTAAAPLPGRPDR